MCKHMYELKKGNTNSQIICKYVWKPIHNQFKIRQSCQCIEVTTRENNHENTIHVINSHTCAVTTVIYTKIQTFQQHTNNDSDQIVTTINHYQSWYSYPAKN